MAFKNRTSRAIALAGLLVVSGSALAEESSYYKLSGYVDLYYQYDFNRPTAAGGVNLRQFDTVDNGLRLALGYLDITRPATDESPLGFTFTLLAGEGTDSIHALEPGGADSYKAFGQAFVTFKAKGSVPFTVDFGKFFTPIGFEATDNRANLNYSRGFNYYATQPLYHTGFRATAAFGDRFTGYAGLVQGWNEVEDSNGAKSFFVGGTYILSSALNVTGTGYFGSEGDNGVNGIGFSSRSDVTLVDAVVNYTLNDTTSLALNADYASAKGKGNWFGIAAYAKRTLGSRATLGLRAEHVEDPDGLRTGFATQYHSFTGTYDYKLDDHINVRLEGRFDSAAANVFNSDGNLKKTRFTLGLGTLIKF